MGQPWGNGFPAWAIRHSPELEALEPDLGLPAQRGAARATTWRGTSSGPTAGSRPTDPQGVVGYLTDAVGALADRVGDHPARGRDRDPQRGVGRLAGADLPRRCPCRLPARRRLRAAHLAAAHRPHPRRPTRTCSCGGSRRRRSTSPRRATWPTRRSRRPIADPQIGFAFHDYCAFGELSTYLGLPAALQQGCDLHHDLTWGNAATFEARTGLPQLVTEFGNIDDGDRARAVAAPLRRHLHRLAVLALRRRLRSREASSEPFTETQLQHLVRTYPVATAGTPGPMSFEPSTGEMRYSFTPRAASAPTEIAVSDVHYPAGYEVVVTGGRVTSAAGAARVTIEADAGATAVTVTVRRASSGGPTTSAATSPQVS